MSTQRIQVLRERLATLARRSAEFWKQHGPDREHGGFHGTLDRNGAPIAPTEKSLIQQVRHLWGMSLWHQYKEPSAAVRALADDLYQFVCTHFFVPGTGEYAYLVDRRGRVVDQRHVLYAQSFTIYGFAEYARAFEHEPALSAALRLFHSIDARAHDSEHGGYLQHNDAPWLPPGCEKETNTHIHLMEAYAALFSVSHDPRVQERLEELVTLVTTKLLQPESYVHKNFTRDWAPVGDKRVSYGHDIETYWLLDDAARVLGRPLDCTILEPARRMALHSADAGYDHTHGGYFEEGPVGSAADKLEKVWWVQAEAIPGLFRLFEQTRDSKWLDRMQGTLDYIERQLLNAATGEWYWGVLPDGSIGPRGDGMGEHWKACYHVLRALVLTERWMSTWLDLQPTTRAS